MNADDPAIVAAALRSNERAHEAFLRVLEEALRLRADQERLDWLDARGMGIAIVHDDEDAWIVSGDGMQSLRSTLEPGDAWSTTIIVGPEDFGDFRGSVREAIDAARAKEKP